MLNDLISRQAAIKAIYNSTADGDRADWFAFVINQVPAADTQQVRHAHWIDKNGSIASCSMCKDRWGVWSVMNYCPSCGARMVPGGDPDIKRTEGENL